MYAWLHAQTHHTDQRAHVHMTHTHTHTHTQHTHRDTDTHTYTYTYLLYHTSDKVLQANPSVTMGYPYPDFIASTSLINSIEACTYSHISNYSVTTFDS